MRLVDRVIKVTDTEAFENARIRASREGIFAGSSSGAALAVASGAAAITYTFQALAKAGEHRLRYCCP